MKVALVIYRYNPDGGGVERAVDNLARGLIERGHEVHLFAKRFHGAPPDAKAHSVGASSILPGGRHITFAHNAREAVAAERFDVVHSFTRTVRQDILRLGGGTHRGYLDCMLRERSALGAWFSMLNPKERVILRLEKEGFLAKNTRRIVAVSHRVKNEVIRHSGVPEENIVVIHNGVDTLRFTPELRETARPQLRRTLGLDGAFTLLYCGAGFVRKGLRYAIDTLARVPDAHLLVVGAGNTGPFRRQAEKRGVHRRVMFLGPRTGIEQFYAAADVLIHPSLYDPFPNACLEAMACGTPVVTTEVTGVAEIIAHGENSFVVERGDDVDQLAACVNAAREKPDIGSAAAELAAKHNLDRNVDENVELYYQIQGERQRPASQTDANTPAPAP